MAHEPYNGAMTDNDALIHAILVEPGGAVRHLDWDGLRAWRPEQGLLWAHFQIDAPETRRWLEREAGLPRHVPTALTVIESRPRASVIGEGILLVLRGVNLNPGADPEDMVAIRLWVEQSRIISTRRRRLLSVVDTVNSIEEQAPASTGDLVLRLADRLTDRINDVINEIEERVDDLEDGLLTEPSEVMRGRLSGLRRDAIGLRRYLAPQREALGRLLSEPLAGHDDFDKPRLREIHDRVVRLVEDLDTVRERASVIHEELVSRLSDQLNKRMYVLSIVAALFLPLSFLTGLLGINVGGIPGAESPYGFLGFSAILVTLLCLQVWFFVRQRWF